MPRLLATLLLLLSATSVVAQPPLTITPSGYYITQINAQGEPVLVKITVIIDLTGDSPIPIPPNNDTVDLEVVKQVTIWATTVNDPQGGQALAAVYSHVKSAVDDAILNQENVWSALKDASDSAITIVEGTDKWKVFRDELSTLITERRQKGTLQNKANIALFTKSVQQGLELSADGSTALSLDILTRIAAKTNEAIDANK